MADRAVDGNTTTCAETKKEYMPWWRVDLGRIVTFLGVKIVSGKGKLIFHVVYEWCTIHANGMPSEISGWHTIQ